MREREGQAPAVPTATAEAAAVAEDYYKVIEEYDAALQATSHPHLDREEIGSDITSQWRLRNSFQVGSKFGQAPVPGRASFRYWRFGRGTKL